MFLFTSTKNRKIGDIACTYLPIKQTCPSTCALKDNGCYAQVGYVGLHMRRLEHKTEGMKAYDIIRKEAREIASVGPTANGKALRLHISGDARTAKSANLLRDAAKKWNGKVFTYTHAWRDIARHEWGNISVLASVENLHQAKEAIDAGYAPAVTVAHHPADGKAYYKDGVKVIPCPQQTKEITCDNCRLCMNDSMLYQQGAAIAFAIHGVRKKRMLTVIQ